jgi:histidine ammonia-lyase
MGPIAARHARAIVANTALTLALEAFMAAQAIDFRLRRSSEFLVLSSKLPDDPQLKTQNHALERSEGSKLKTPSLGKGSRAAYDLIRSRIPFLERDEDMQPHIAAAVDLVTSGALASVVRG